MTFDTLEFSRRLKSAGFTEQQAEVLAEATRDHVTEEMVTKSFLQSEMQKLNQKLEFEVEKLRSEMEKLSMRLTIRMGTIAVAVVGALAAIIKL
jgi:type II secretory pathway component PulL